LFIALTSFYSIFIDQFLILVILISVNFWTNLALFIEITRTVGYNVLGSICTCLKVLL